MILFAKYCEKCARWFVISASDVSKTVWFGNCAKVLHTEG